MDGWGGMKAGAVRDICRIHPFRKHRHDKIHFLSASHSFIFFSLFFFSFFSLLQLLASFLFFSLFLFLSLSLKNAVLTRTHCTFFFKKNQACSTRFFHGGTRSRFQIACIMKLSPLLREFHCEAFSCECYLPARVH